MKRFLLLLFLTLHTLCVSSQSMSFVSFVYEERDQDARINYRKLDQNGDIAAIIKVETTEKGFSFDVGQLGVVDVDHNRVAETWVYVPKGVLHIVISHERYGREKYDLPMPIHSASVYRLKLSVDASDQIVSYQYFKLKVEKPTDRATKLYIYDKSSSSREAKYEIDSQDGRYSQKLDRGDYIFRVEADNYNPIEGEFSIRDNTVEESISLTPNYGYISISATPAATVKINDINYGSTPYKTQELPLGSYRVVLTTPNYERVERVVALTDPEAVVSLAESMTYRLRNLSVTTLDGASIYVDNELKGVSRWQGDLLPGKYLVRCSKEGYRELSKEVTLSDNPLKENLSKLEPRYGWLHVTTKMNDIVVTIDGVRQTEMAPAIYRNVLACDHDVTYSREGYKSKSERVTIKEGTVTETSPVSLDVEEQFGWISIWTTQGADITITNSKTGKSHSVKAGLDCTKSARLDYGEYKVQISKADHKTIIKRVTIDQPKQDDIWIDEELNQSLTYKINNRRFKYFGIGQYGYNPSQSSYGAMVGFVATPRTKGGTPSNGAYLRYTYSFTSTPNTTIECTNDGLSGTSFTSSAQSSFSSFTFGWICGSVDCKYMGYFGLGKGSRKLVWETTDGEYALNTDRSAGGGVAIDLGFMYRYDRTLFTIGGNFLPSLSEENDLSSFRAISLGVGLVF